MRHTVFHAAARKFKADQHSLVVQWAGGLIQPSILKEDIRRVADVATGAGNWLIDIAKELDNPTNVYKGFDVSPAQFPLDTTDAIGGFDFVQHNMLERFPVAYHGQFDLVNIRLVVQAVKAADVPLIVSNLKGLLRPGGYLQWQDLVWNDVRPDPYQQDIQDIVEIIRAHMNKHGLSQDLPALARSGMEQAGLQEVTFAKKTREDCLPPLRPEYVSSLARHALVFMLPKVLETKMISENKAVDTAAIKAQAAQLAIRLDQVYADGYNTAPTYVVVVGKRPLK
ncbi:hypothetical protein AJ79_03977 [Helicocarpus griseus UAMH5409]|uniref:Methyltransferase type 12 domain-containing protein n=1 Tax=Helicocarpus griseus UAMH5409 TaxID=1447875 RepID=A0A2B7XWJ2_9EURO|nr:hypothetical protein AJ79_03977 [Helicocarpus griseus UAMH5409]